MGDLVPKGTVLMTPPLILETPKRWHLDSLRRRLVVLSSDVQLNEKLKDSKSPSE